MFHLLQCLSLKGIPRFETPDYDSFSIQFSPLEEQHTQAARTAMAGNGTAS